jgi:hypothetical protein
VPVTLHKDGRSRPPHLKPWRDGWRHLRFMLLFSPRWLFFAPGIFLSALGNGFWQRAFGSRPGHRRNQFERRHADDGVHDRHRRLSTRRRSRFSPRCLPSPRGFCRMIPNFRASSNFSISKRAFCSASLVLLAGVPAFARRLDLAAAQLRHARLPNKTCGA